MLQCWQNIQHISERFKLINIIHPKQWHEQKIIAFFCCFCEKNPETSCAGNTDSVNQTDINNYDSETSQCKDDCEEGYECVSSSCTCVMASSGTQTAVLVIGGKNYPTYQFFKSGGPHASCEPIHWHAEGKVYAIGDQSSTDGITDLDEPACGFEHVGVVVEATVSTSVDDDAKVAELVILQ